LAPSAQIRSDFDSLAGEYAQYRSSYSDELFDSVVAYAGSSRGLRALDLACGTGLSSGGLVTRGRAVTGVDVASGMLDVARKKVDAAFYEARAEALPFADSSFSLITCGQAFHWFDADAALGEITRTLAPGGALAIYWKDALQNDPFTNAADKMMNEWTKMDSAPIKDEYLIGFPAFWRQRYLVDKQERTLDLTLRYTVASFIGYHRSRENVRLALGDRREAYIAALEERIASLAPASGEFEVAARQYLFLARRSGRP
jgi:ubiquinone/menaquinone biosynthesis C-methylase UbiE